jgi:hypothetical protein
MLARQSTKRQVVDAALVSGSYEGKLLSFGPIFPQRLKPGSIVIKDQMRVTQREPELIASVPTSMSGSTNPSSRQALMIFGIPDPASSASPM